MCRSPTPADAAEKQSPGERTPDSDLTRSPNSKLARFNLAEICAQDLSAGWSGPKQEAEIRYRLALKGGRRTFKVKAWWPAGSLRPPAETVYVLEVHYRDTAAAPVVFYSHGGLGVLHGQSEVHRFGGTGDGKWKVANVPLSWDYVIRLLNERDKTALGIRADADLPVGAITVRRATEADEVRYNAETRAWIAAVQAERRKRNPLKLRPRQFLSGKKLPAVVAFSWPAMTLMMPTAQPKDEQVGAAVRIRMCLNELEGGSFGVYANGADLTGVDYSVSKLTGPAGELKVDVIRRTAEYCLGTRFPQRLWRAFETDIPKGQSHWFLLNLRTRRGVAKAGRYTGTITVTSDQGSAKLPLEVEVLPVDLLTMDEAGLLMGGCVTGLLPVHDIAFQVDYNQNATNLWFGGVRPEMTMKRGRLELDFTYLDEWMAGAKKRGLKAIVWFLGGDPYGWPDKVHILRDLARIDTTGAENKRARIAWVKKQATEKNRNTVLPESRALLKQWVRQVDAHARDAGWPEIILTPFDEPAKWAQGPYKKKGNFPGVIGAGPWLKPFFKDCCAAIREAAPNIRIYASIHHNRPRREEGIVFLPDVDVFCTNAIGEDPKLGDKVRAAGKAFWQYTGIGGTKGNPAGARSAFGFFFAAFDSRGSLCWAYNWGPGFDTTAGGPSWMYAWQTPFDTIPAPAFEGLREAWDDRRIIETYKKTFARDTKATAVLDDILKAVRGRARIQPEEWRRQLLDRLAKVK